MEYSRPDEVVFAEGYPADSHFIGEEIFLINFIFEMHFLKLCKRILVSRRISRLHYIGSNAFDCLELFRMT